MGSVLLIGSMVCAVLIPPIPSLPLDLAAGAAFSPFYGALYVMIGAEIGAIAGFLIARTVGRETLAPVFKTEATFCRMCTDHQLMGAIFFARLIPTFSFDMVSYGAGFTNVSLKTFALATLSGMAPPTFAFTYLGSSVVSAQWSLIVAGVGMVLFFLAMPKILAKYRTSAVARIFSRSTADTGDGTHYPGGDSASGPLRWLRRSDQKFITFFRGRRCLVSC